MARKMARRMVVSFVLPEGVSDEEARKKLMLCIKYGITIESAFRPNPVSKSYEQDKVSKMRALQTLRAIKQAYIEVVPAPLSN